jgi:hypothetical protein
MPGLFGYWILLSAPSLVKHGNTVDLDIGAGSVQRPAEASARHLLAAKIVAEGVVEAGKIGRVAQNDTHVDDIFCRRAGGVEYRHQIVERPARLHDDVTFNNGAGGGIERALARHE